VPRHGIPFAGRAPYPADPDLMALRVGLVAAQEGWCTPYSRATFHDWFIDRRAPGVGDHVERVLSLLGKSADVIARAGSAEGARLMQEATDAARKLGIFGAPTLAVGTEIFWGDDRLEEAIAFAARLAR
jgi:2-hydroxychromene-2-carboxylate isomerase